MYEIIKNRQYLNDNVECSELALSCTSVNAQCLTPLCRHATEHRYDQYCDSGNEEDFDKTVKLCNRG